jgi:hypothetical protein
MKLFNAVAILTTVVGTTGLFVNKTEVLLNSEVLLKYSETITPSLYDLIWRGSVFSAIAYCTKHNRVSLGPLPEACPCTLCTDSPDIVEVSIIYAGTVSGVVFRDDTTREIVVGLKGTTTNTEWAIDFNIIPVPYHSLNKRPKGLKKWYKQNKECKGCTIHKGFYSGAKEIHDKTFDKVIALAKKYPDYKIMVTGHSLGGALAPLIANEYLKMGLHTTLITFGSPKIGNPLFAKWMDDIWNTHDHYSDLDGIHSTSSFIRVSHKDDFVPLVPTRQMGYKHCGIDVFFTTPDLPMDITNIKLRNSPSQLSVNEAEEEVELIFSNSTYSDYQKSMDSHRNYLLRMNQC